MMQSSENHAGVYLPKRDALAILLAILLPTLVTVAYFFLAADYRAEAQRATYVVGKIVQFTFPLFWVAVVQQNAIRLSPPRAAGMAVGLGFGLLTATAILILYSGYFQQTVFFEEAAQTIRKKLFGFDINNRFRYIVLAMFYSLFHSLLEEYYWRWFVFGQLRKLTTLRTAITLSSIGFALHHVLVLAEYFGWCSLVTLFFSLAVALGGTIWAWIYHQTHSLYSVWLSHFLIDVGIFFIGYQLVRTALEP